MSTLMVTRAVYDAFRAHGEEAYPHECCGALLGQPDAKGWRVMESITGGKHADGFGAQPLPYRSHRAGANPAHRARQRAEDCRVLSLPSRPSGAMVYNRFC